MLGLANTRVSRRNEVALISKRWNTIQSWTGASHVRGSLRLHPAPTFKFKSNYRKQGNKWPLPVFFFQPWLFDLVSPSPLQLPLLEDSNWYQRHIVLIISLLLLIQINNIQGAIIYRFFCVFTYLLCFLCHTPNPILSIELYPQDSGTAHSSESDMKVCDDGIVTQCWHFGQYLSSCFYYKLYYLNYF